MVEYTARDGLFGLLPSPFSIGEVQPAKVYAAVLDKVEGVLRQQSGLVTLEPGISVYFYPDPQAQPDRIRNFWNVPFIGRKSSTKRRGTSL